MATTEEGGEGIVVVALTEDEVEATVVAIRAVRVEVVRREVVSLAATTAESMEVGVRAVGPPSRDCMRCRKRRRNVVQYYLYHSLTIVFVFAYVQSVFYVLRRVVFLGNRQGV